MGFLLDADKVGKCLGLLVFVVMAAVGWARDVPIVTVLSRAVLGGLVAYVVGYLLSRYFGHVLTEAMVADKQRREPEPEKNEEPEEEQG